MPQSRIALERGARLTALLTCTNLVGKDGIEPPNLPVSVAGTSVQQGARLMELLVKWHPAEQASARFGRVLVDRLVDRTC
jgi:hypothetical protein